MKAKIEEGKKKEKPSLAPWQAAALYSPFDHFAMICGVAVGKTFTGCHFAIMMMKKHPDLTGFIGANTYDQLSQATLKELFFWLDEYDIPFVIDKRPPTSWGPHKQFKDYNNVLSCYIRGKVVHAFTRTLSKGNSLRGMEFSWYWIDESRDTPLNTHDVILSRLRESNIVRGLVTTTTNSEDWVYQRFVRGNTGGRRFGSIHVPTRMSVEYGIITEDFYNTLRSSYSELMAQQELDALHVNVLGGRAYYASSERNCLIKAPWGDYEPNPERGLVLGCDFNYQPAPCIWMIGQVGPDIIDPRTGLYFSDSIHWFDEVVLTQASTFQMVDELVRKYPNFFYQFFGDASGQRGTTSNAGETDYIQIANRLDDYGIPYSISVPQANPKIKDRIETMNTLFRNALGQIRQTYNPIKCQYFHSDTKVVGWKKLTGMQLNGKLDDTGDKNRTHATDGAGYAVYQLFPVGRRAYVPPSMPSSVRSGIDLV